MYDSPDPWVPATAAEWPSTTVPAPLLEALRGQASDRKCRLFACACCRRIWEALPELERRGVIIAEAYADGLASEDERWGGLESLLETAGGEVHREVGSRSWAVVETGEIPNPAIAAILTEMELLVCGLTGRAIKGTAGGGMELRAIIGAHLSARCASRQPLQGGVVQDHWLGRMWRRTVQRLTGSSGVSGAHREWMIHELSCQADLVRDIFGTPFRAVSIDHRWRTSTAVALAAQMYESRDFGAMPILADALQDAGCDSAGVLDHCRGPGPHVRGCWMVDLVLGKA